MDHFYSLLKSYKKIVFLGIGNTLYDDDSFGPLFIQELQEVAPPTWILIDCHTAPENFIGKVISLQPDLIVFVDTIYAPEVSYEVLFFPVQELKDKTTGTHRVSFSELGSLIQEELDSPVYVLGFNKNTVSDSQSYSQYITNVIRKLLTGFRTNYCF